MELLKDKRVKISLIIIAALVVIFYIAVATGAFSIIKEASSRMNNRGLLSEQSNERLTKDVLKYEGFANCDENGKFTPISEDDLIVQRVSEIGKAAACAMYTADYRTATGEEGYEYLEPWYAARLKDVGEPLTLLRELQNGQIVTTGTNPEVISVVVFPDLSAYIRLQLEYNFLEVGNPDGLSDTSKEAGIAPQARFDAKVQFKMKPKSDGTYEIIEKSYGEQ